MRLNAPLLTRLEGLLEAYGYAVRYEKGNFRGGSCVVETEQLVVVNKFSPLESRIYLLMDVVLSLPVPDSLPSDAQKLLQQVRELRREIPPSEKGVVE